MLDLSPRATDRVFNMATLLVERHATEGRAERPALRLSDRVVSYAELPP